MVGRTYNQGVPVKPQHLLTTAAIALVVVVAYDKLYKKA
jgi:hypothetical protein